MLCYKNLILVFRKLGKQVSLNFTFLKHIIIKDAVSLKHCYVLVSTGHVSLTALSFHKEGGRAFREAELPWPLPQAAFWACLFMFWNRVSLLGMEQPAEEVASRRLPFSP